MSDEMDVGAPNLPAEWAGALEDLRAEIAQLRAVLGIALDDVRHRLEELGELRHAIEEIRDQLVQTVSGANRWFVQARDDLLERVQELGRAPVAPVTASTERELADAVHDLQAEVQAMGATLLALRREMGRRGSARPVDAPIGPGIGPAASGRPTYEELIGMLVKGTFES